MDKWKDLCIEMDTFEEEFRIRFNCEPGEASIENIKLTRNKEALLIDWVVKFGKMYENTKMLTTSAAMRIEELTSNVTKGQEKVIALQDEIIKVKDEELASVRTSVKNELASVQTTLKDEIKSWSKIVEQNSSQTITTAKLKEAVKCAVVDEDRCRNIVIFGKEENAHEDVAETVTSILEDLDEKPPILECRRIGTAVHGKCRSIKVKLSNSDTVSHILRKCKLLKSSENNKTTFIDVDRSKEEIIEHRKLVGKLKL